MSFLPAGYASPVDLPFNRASLKDHFKPEAPDADPGGAGVWVLLQKQSLIVVSGGSAPTLPTAERAPLDAVSSAQPLYIGRWQGQPCRLLAVSQQVPIPQHLTAEPLLARDPHLTLPLLSLGGLGHMILHWETVSRHCGNCGGAMIHLDGEWGKQCQQCPATHFPRIHPCVIVSIQKDDQLLLVRKAEWPDNRFGLVAGFVDFGENFEEAVAREVREETGIEICNIRYIGSQCWPFPSQLMAGFVADYRAGELVLQDRELSEAGWFDKQNLPTLPPQRSIARYLIDAAR